MPLKMLYNKAREQYRDPLYRNSYYLMANTIVNSGLGFVFWMLAARFYSEADVGVATGLLSASTLVVNLANFGINSAVIRFLPKHDDKRKFVNTCITAIGLMTFAASVIFLLGMDIWASKLSFIKSHPEFIAAFVAFTAISGIGTIISNIFIAHRQAKYNFISNLITAALKIPLPIVLAPMFGVFGVFGSWGIALTVSVLASLFIFMRIIQPGYFPYPAFSKGTLKEISGFSFANYIAGLIATIPGQLIPLMILGMLTAESNAYYYVTNAIAGILFIIPNALSTSLFAEGSTDETNFKPKMFKAAKTAYALLFAGVAGTALLGKYLLLLFGDTYSSSGHILLSAMALSSLFMVLPSFYNTYLRIRMRMAEFQVLSAFSALGIVGISYALLPKMGILAVGVAYAITYLSLTFYVALMLFSRRRPKAA